MTGCDCLGATRYAHLEIIRYTIYLPLRSTQHKLKLPGPRGAAFHSQDVKEWMNEKVWSKSVRGSSHPVLLISSDWGWSSRQAVLTVIGSSAEAALTLCQMRIIPTGSY
jgi:hypothetical protein